MTGRLAGKRALITGAGGLMGRDTALAFAEEGADLVISTRTVAKLEPLAEEIRDRGARCTAIAADFTRDEDVDHLADAAWNAFGGIDVVLLSSQPPQPSQGELLNAPEHVWQEQQRAIVWGPFRMLRRLAPRMISNGGGSIITVTSSTGCGQPLPGYGAYGIAKGTLWVLTQYMAAEWGKHGIRANAFEPGSVATGDDAQAIALQESLTRSGWINRTSLGRVGRNRECMGALIYLASNESSFMSGHRLVVNGGRF